MSKSDKKQDEHSLPEDYAVTFFSKNLVGISANRVQRQRRYSREHVRRFLNDPFNNSARLQEIAQYLKATSGNYFRIIKYLSGILTFDHMLLPTSKLELSGRDLAMEKYKHAATTLEKMNIRYNFRWILERLLDNGEIYLYAIDDGDSVVFKELPPSFCRISAIKNGVYMYEIDLSLLNDTIIDDFPEEIKRAYRDGDTGVDSWYQVSDKGFAFNAIGNYPHGFPVLCMMFDDIMGLEDTKDLIESKNKLDAIKLVHQKIPLNDNHEPVFNMQTAKIYHDATKRGLPDGVAITTNPLDIDQIPFDKAVSREDDVIERAERNIWNSSGISDMIFSNNKASGEALKRSITADETLMFPFLFMFQNYVNSRIIDTQFKVNFLEVSYFSREDKLRVYKDLLGYGGSRMYFMALQGLDPIQVITILEFEQRVLDIDKYMIPKQTSHTLSGDDKEAGRPTQEERGEEVKENTELDRDRK